MSITISQEVLEKNLLKINLTGTLDAPGAMSIEEAFQANLEEHSDRVIVDLSGVDFMSSYGLRMLVVGAKTISKTGGEFCLAAPDPRVMDLIKIAGVETMLPIYESVEKAIESFNS